MHVSRFVSETMRLSLLRHGLAEANSPEDDQSRELTAKGFDQARAAAQRLVAISEPLPDKIIYSPAKRTQQTAETLIRNLPLPPSRHVIESRLYLADTLTLWTLIQEHAASAEHLLLVGHNPGLSELAQSLGVRLPIGELPTGGLVTGELASHQNSAGEIVPGPFNLLP